MLDVSEFATPAQKNNIQNVYRQLGLGVMGWSDALKDLEVQYDSKDHLELIKKVGEWIADRAYRTSENLAAEKGSCGVWNEIKDVVTGNPFEQWISVDEEFLEYRGNEVTLDDQGQPYETLTGFDVKQKPRRNATVLSIAPTGSIAQLAACSWAFEPDFGLSIWKQVFVDASKSEQQWVQILNPYVDSLDLSEEDKAEVLRTGSIQNTEFAKQNPETAAVYKIASEITPEWHIKVQAAWQNWVDSGISKTINLPKEATTDDIKQAYRLAHKLGLKGITIYRSGTLESEPIKVGDDAKEEKKEWFDKPEDPQGEYKSGCKSGLCEI